MDRKLEAMPSLIEFLLRNFLAGFALGAGIALWTVAGGIGPGAHMSESWLAAALYVLAVGGSLGLGYLSTAVLSGKEL
jgi:hypothetical protein